MTTEPPTTEPWICGYRERDGHGIKECVGYPDHDGQHYLVRLVQRVEEEAV